MSEKIQAKLKHLLLMITSLCDDDELPMKTRAELVECYNSCQAISNEFGGEVFPLKEGASAPKTKQKSTLLGKEEKRLYIVDDDDDIQRMLGFTLKKRGFEVISETDPIAALKNLAKVKPDIILLDLMMPGMTGFEFLGHMQNNPLRKEIKIVVGSSRNFEKDRITVLEAGANDFIAKPYNIKELSLKLHSVFM